MEAAVKSKRIGMDLTQGSVMRGLVLFAIPIVLANLIQQLYSLVDLMVIGQFMGATGTVGVSTGGEIADMLTPIATSFGTAGQIYIAQLAGARQDKKSKEAIGTFISMMELMSVAFMAATILFRVPILQVLNCPQEAFSEADNYMVITALGMPFIFGYNAICGILRGMGESKRPMLFITIAAIVNIFLDILLVAPPFNMQAAGTAIATVISQAASCIAAFVYMYKRRSHFDFEMKLSYFRMHWEPAKIILSLGVPQAARSLLVRFSMLWVNASVNAYGLTESATNSVGNKLQKFLEVYSMGLSQAAAAMIGQNLGARKNDRARKVVWYTFALSLAITGVIVILVLICPKAIFGIFTKDDAVLAMGVDYLHIMIVHFFFSALTGSFQSMMIGCGYASMNFVVGILDGVVCKIGLSVLFANVLHMGAYGYFWGTALSRALPGALVLWYFLSNKWAERKLLTDD
jgi:putative MATE family efflux protein